jgi:hypothetical protein
MPSLLRLALTGPQWVDWTRIIRAALQRDSLSA